MGFSSFFKQCQSNFLVLKKKKGQEFKKLSKEQLMRRSSAWMQPQGKWFQRGFLLLKMSLKRNICRLGSAIKTGIWFHLYKILWKTLHFFKDMCMMKLNPGQRGECKKKVWSVIPRKQSYRASKLQTAYVWSVFVLMQRIYFKNSFHEFWQIYPSQLRVNCIL